MVTGGEEPQEWYVPAYETQKWEVEGDGTTHWFTHAHLKPYSRSRIRYLLKCGRSQSFTGERGEF